MVDIGSAALDVLRLYGPLALLLFTFLETSLLFPFLPSEVVVPAAAALLITGPVSFLVFVGAATVGGTVGAYVPFYVFHETRAGRVGWLNDLIRVSEDRLESGREWFTRWGQSSVLWGRLLPVLRSVVSIPAGFADMGSVRFGAYTAIGTVAFYGASGAVVYYARQQSLFATAFDVATARPWLTAVTVAAVGGLGVIGWWLYRNRAVRA